MLVILSNGEQIIRGAVSVKFWSLFWLKFSLILFFKIRSLIFNSGFWENDCLPKKMLIPCQSSEHFQTENILAEHGLPSIFSLQTEPWCFTGLLSWLPDALAPFQQSVESSFISHDCSLSSPPRQMEMCYQRSLLWRIMGDEFPVLSEVLWL